MSSVAATSASGTTKYTDDTTSRVTQKNLGQSDFLKLLTTQMTNQDPLNPTSSTDQIAQLAQFSSLQSMNNLLINSQLEGASSMIGKKVTVTDSSSKTATGTVQSAQVKAGVVYVNVDGTSYEYSKVTKIETAATTTTSS